MMFRGSYQRKLLTVLYSGGSNPLEIWDIQVKNGWTRRVKDEDMGTIVFEVCGTNVATAYIVSPPNPRGALGITLPFITMLIKNLKRYFTFEIQILDDKRMRRRFRFSNYQSSTKVRPFTCSVPLALKPGWNQMQLNLANFTMRAYGANYMETQRIQIHANCRVRRIYFSDRLYAEEELPRDYRIYLNVRQAPRPPDTEAKEQAPNEPLRASPSSILRVPSKAEGTLATVLSEVEVADTSFQSSALMADRQSLKTGSSVAQIEPRKSTLSTSTKQWSRSVIEPESTPKGSLSRMSQQNVTAYGEVLLEAETPSPAVEEDVLQEKESGTDVDIDHRFEEVADEQREDVVEREEVEYRDEGGREDEVVAEPEEQEAGSASPRSEPTESEYAESELVPESEDSEPPTD